MNPLFNQINNNNGQQMASSIGELKRLFSASKNPMAMFMQVAQQKPEMRPILDALQNGKKPRDILIEECRKRGIDPQQFLNQI